jgi:anaerobic magnesium-protoporphyrin IX monomethyl ester cyclase
MSLDVLILSIPPTYLDEPTAAPAILKGAVEKNGYTCKTVDFSLLCFDKLFQKNYDSYLKWIRIFLGTYDWENLSDDHRNQIDQSLALCIQTIEQYRPRLVGISIFSDWHHRYAYLLCHRIKTIGLDIPIVIGGSGCTKYPSGLDQVTHLSYFDKNQSWSSFMFQKKLVDHVIISDGEKELVTLLGNLSNYQSDFKVHEAEFDNYYYPDYGDYDLDGYLYTNNEKKLLIQGSKGCVRQCIFCDEHRNYSKFYYKNGDDIADEMIDLSDRYKVYKFQFTDSLVNGSLNSFYKLISKLALHNEQTGKEKITWHGNYICRKNNDMDDDYYRLLKKSGAHGLTIGAESGSNRVLRDMKKNTTVEDLLHEISKFQHFDIDCYLLFMVGFYTETWQDFLDTLKLLKKLQPFVFSKTVYNIRAGSSFLISDWKHYKIDDFICDPTNRLNWIYKDNPSLDFKERYRRRIILQEFCDKLHIPVAYANEDLILLDGMYNNAVALDRIDSLIAHN